MVVGKRIVFSGFSNKVFNHVTLGCKENLLYLKDFKLHIFGDVDLELVVHPKQELFVERGRGGETNIATDGLNAFVYLFLENFVVILNDVEVRVAHPCINKLLIKVTGHLRSLISCFIRLLVVELLSSISSCNHVNHCLIAPVSKLDGVPSCLVEQSLPHVTVGVSASIHDSSVANYHCLLVTVEGNVNKNIFESHLRTHNVDLEPHCLVQRQFVCLDHCSALH